MNASDARKRSSRDRPSGAPRGSVRRPRLSSTASPCSGRCGFAPVFQTSDTVGLPNVTGSVSRATHWRERRLEIRPTEMLPSSIRGGSLDALFPKRPACRTALGDGNGCLGNGTWRYRDGTDPRMRHGDCGGSSAAAGRPAAPGRRRVQNPGRRRAKKGRRNAPRRSDGPDAIPRRDTSRERASVVARPRGRRAHSWPFTGSDAFGFAGLALAYDRRRLTQNRPPRPRRTSVAGSGTPVMITLSIRLVPAVAVVTSETIRT